MSTRVSGSVLGSNTYISKNNNNNNSNDNTEVDINPLTPLECLTSNFSSQYHPESHSKITRVREMITK